MANLFYRALAFLMPALAGSMAFGAAASAFASSTLIEGAPVPVAYYRRGSGYGGGKGSYSGRIAPHCRAMCWRWLNQKHGGYKVNEQVG